MFERWAALMGRLGAEPADLVRTTFEELQARYKGADRRYHDFGHIAACLGLLDEVRGLARRADAVEAAIWFHDAIYDSHRSDNEALSAQLAVEALAALGVAGEFGELVRELILVTRHKDVPSDPDGALLVDIDLAILGQSEAVFDAYEAGVRAEYAWVTEEAFRAGRAKVLRSFLARERIFTTGHFHGLLEGKARENLRRSLGKLEG